MSKLVFINRYFYPDHSATAQLLSDLAFGLAAAGQVVHVITSRQLYSDAAAALAAEARVEGVRVHRVWTSRFGRGHLMGRAFDYLTFYLGAGWRLWRLARHGDVVVVETDPPLISVVAVPVARWRGALVVNWLQDLFPEAVAALAAGRPTRPEDGLPTACRCGRVSRILLRTGAAYLRRCGVLAASVLLRPSLWVLRAWRNASLRRAALHVVPGERIAAYLRAEGIPLERIRVIHNWADGGAITPLPHHDNPLRTDWGLTERFVVAYAGNLGRAHEFGTMLDAAERLRGEADIVFLFIGSGHYRPWVETQARRRQLSNVLFKPYQPRERLHESLGLADVHLISLLPALEGLMVPSKFYGIAAAGRPTIYVGDANGEIPCILKTFECGVTVAPDDPAALVRELRVLVQNHELRQRLGKNARHVFDQRFERQLALRSWSALLSRHERRTAAPTPLAAASPRSTPQ